VKAADAVLAEAGSNMKYKVGTMIEIPRAALTADEIAKEAEFFSFGTNDLTQMTFGFSRDDAGKFLGAYYERKIYENDPFARVDQIGVGKLVKMAATLGRQTRPDLHLGVCGEHGGDPSSVEFFHKVGLDYVSCSPFRVPIARLAAAQAAIKEDMAKASAAENPEAEVKAKVEAARSALKEAAEKLSSAAENASAELKDFAQAGIKSLLAGWEEAKKTFNKERK
jgi:phosphoenolpyruvate-protein kinase (PTS system EI component)